jgi:tRNA A37 threonylcarbamoyladenosine dehydratase
MDQKHVSMSNFNHDERTLLSLNGSTKIQMQSEHMSGVHPSVVSRIVFPIT